MELIFFGLAIVFAYCVFAAVLDWLEGDDNSDGPVTEVRIVDGKYIVTVGPPEPPSYTMDSNMNVSGK